MTIAKHLAFSSLLASSLFLAGLSAAAADDRSIAVSGTATVSVAPDIARINMSVVERNKSVGAAQQAAATVTNRVLGLLDKLNIDRKHINTTGAMIRPEYRWDREREQQELIGYIVERTVRVELRDLEQLGKLLEQVSAAGINQLSPPQLDSSTKRAVKRKALALAVSDARQNAAVIATAAGGELGEVLSIGAGQGSPPPRPMLRAAQADMAMASEGVQESFTPGEISFTATVNAIYALEDK
jgi:uncharacterized protein YggE